MLQTEVFLAHIHAWLSHILMPARFCMQDDEFGGRDAMQRRLHLVLHSWQRRLEAQKRLALRKAVLVSDRCAGEQGRDLQAVLCQWSDMDAVGRCDR